jgi:antitoxin (DNA-binding transcriptional repressor) of toxin-antitoxin stability system
MTIVTIHKAKTELSKLLKRVEAGEEITIARGDKVVARLCPPKLPVAKSRGRGALKHLGLMIPDSAFFDPLPDEELDAWEGKFGFDP